MLEDRAARREGMNGCGNLRRAHEILFYTAESGLFNEFRGRSGRAAVRAVFPARLFL
jgi:hypothetical protein